MKIGLLASHGHAIQTSSIIICPHCLYEREIKTTIIPSTIHLGFLKRTHTLSLDLIIINIQDQQIDLKINPLMAESQCFTLNVKSGQLNTTHYTSIAMKVGTMIPLQSLKISQICAVGSTLIRDWCAIRTRGLIVGISTFKTVFNRQIGLAIVSYGSVWLSVVEHKYCLIKYQNCN